MRRRPAAGLLAVLLVFLAGCTSPGEKRVAELKSQANADVHVLINREDLVVGAYTRSDASRGSWPCFVANGGGQGGGPCMTAVGDGTHPGWAVELSRQRFGQEVLFVATDPRAALVRIPRSSGGFLEIVPRHVNGFRQLLNVSLGPFHDIQLIGNTAQAFDASGRLLGTTHDCEGLGGPPDCGPYEGLLDKNMPRPGRSAR